MLTVVSKAPRRSHRQVVMSRQAASSSMLPAEVFKEANRFGADYRIVLLSPTGADVMSSLGVRVAVDGAVSSEPTFGTFRRLSGESPTWPRRIPVGATRSVNSRNTST